MQSSNTLDILRATVKKHWGFEHFRPLQEQSINAILEHRDSVVVVPARGRPALLFAGLPFMRELVLEHSPLDDVRLVQAVDPNAVAVDPKGGNAPDTFGGQAREDFDWPVHHILLSAGTLIAEHVTNLEGLRGQRIEVMFPAINIAGSDGAPARVLARPMAG